jgi:Spy/CpxP family protein refolding chaperone
MSRGRTTFVALIGAVAMATGSSAAAEPPRPGQRLECITERLDLDADTEAAVEAVVEESRSQARALHDEVREARRALHDLLWQETPDEAAVMAHAQALGDLETNAMKHRLAALLRIGALLTPAQRTEMVEMRHKHRASIVEACEADVEAFCSDAGDPREALRCLKRNTEELSDECREVLPRRGRGRGLGLGFGRGPGPGLGLGPDCGRF